MLFNLSLAIAQVLCSTTHKQLHLKTENTNITWVECTMRFEHVIIQECVTEITYYNTLPLQNISNFTGPPCDEGS